MTVRRTSAPSGSLLFTLSTTPSMSANMRAATPRECIWAWLARRRITIASSAITRPYRSEAGSSRVSSAIDFAIGLRHPDGEWAGLLLTRDAPGPYARGSESTTVVPCPTALDWNCPIWVENGTVEPCETERTMRSNTTRDVMPIPQNGTVPPRQVPHTERRPREYLTPKEVHRLIAAVRQNRCGHRDAPAPASNNSSASSSASSELRSAARKRPRASDPSSRSLLASASSDPSTRPRPC